MRSILMIGQRSLLVYVVPLMIAVGCGAPAAVITGVVTLDGQSLPNATLEFYPVSGRGRVSFTKTDQSGRYRVEVFPTPLKVMITATKADGKEKNPFDPDGPLVDRLVSALPERFGSQEKTPLVAEPVDGRITTIDFLIDSSDK
jgi:hypothetical protein